MEVIKIISECLIKMGEKDFTANQTYTTAQQSLADKLLGALNVIYREAVVEYLPLIAKQEIELGDDGYEVSGLAHAILYPIRLEKDGARRRTYVFPTRIGSDFVGKATLTYAYTPSQPLTLDGTLDDTRFTVSALSDGTLGEYYFQNKVFDLAKSFDTDFRAAMSMLKHKGKILRVKERRWGE